MLQGLFLISHFGKSCIHHYKKPDIEIDYDLLNRLVIRNSINIVEFFKTICLTPNQTVGARDLENIKT